MVLSYSKARNEYYCAFCVGAPAPVKEDFVHEQGCLLVVAEELQVERIISEQKLVCPHCGQPVQLRIANGQTLDKS